LINIGFLKSVSPIFDFSKIEKNSELSILTNPQPDNANYNELKIGKNIKIKLVCDFYQGPISGEAHVLNLQSMNDSSAVFNVELPIKKSTGEGLNRLLDAIRNKVIEPNAHIVTIYSIKIFGFGGTDNAGVQILEPITYHSPSKN
jgi:hypothetical protein